MTTNNEDKLWGQQLQEAAKQHADERERRLDNIRATSERLTAVAKAYDQLLWMAEQDGSDAFLALAEAAGEMTAASLERVAALLEILRVAKTKLDTTPVPGEVIAHKSALRVTFD